MSLFTNLSLLNKEGKFNMHRHDQKKHSKLLLAFIFLLLLIAIPWRIIPLAAGKTFSFSNVPKTYKEIKKITKDSQYSIIELRSVDLFHDVYCIEFDCHNFSSSDPSQCNKAFQETINAFETIVSASDDGSDFYNKKIKIELRQSESLPLTIELCNYKPDADPSGDENNDFVFNRIISLGINFPLNDISILDDLNYEIKYLDIGPNCKLEKR